MRWVVLSVCLIAALTGCARKAALPADPWAAPALSGKAPPPQPLPPATAKPSGPIVTPSMDTVGKVISSNPRSRYAVLSYALGRLPALDSRVFAYRGGFKVAELRVTGPAKDNNTVADVLVGDCQVGDEVRKD